MNSNYERTMNYEKGLREVTKNLFESFNIDPFFPSGINELEADDLTVADCADRKDFRGENVFTIDCATCKDMDDAVSISRTEDGYRLAVHIADVAAYIQPGSELDEIASYRATSFYLPHRTVPMLPPVLSNDRCSLNPGVERLTLSVIAELNGKGEVTHSEITKGKIRSRVKGVYTEVNKILAGETNKVLREKYHEVFEDLFIMEELYSILRAERIKRGATTLDSNKPLITFLRTGIDLTPVEEGVAENMIEEFMILANMVVAEYLYDNDLPAIYRIQEEKNHMAAYCPVKNHHAELALESYSHFTSPIRRVADLKIHQIISMYLSGKDKDEIHALFDESLVEICDRATKRSRTAKHIQEMCERYCYEQYFKVRRNISYTGIVVGFDYKNHPILQINRYNVKIYAYSIRNTSLGDEYSFRVDYSDKYHKLCTCI